MAPSGCIPAGAPVINDADWFAQPLAWRIQDASWECRLLQFTPDAGGASILSFDITEALPFPPASGSALSYRPGGEDWFGAYQQILVDLIRQTKPGPGMLDYDADLLCNSADTRSFVSWGNYFPASLLDRLSSAERTLFFRLVDSALPVGDLGVLTFIHPLMANQAWSDRHAKLERLVRPHLIYLF